MALDQALPETRVRIPLGAFVLSDRLHVLRAAERAGPGTLDAVQRRFSQVDVFTTAPYRGNPVAVVLDGEGLTTDEMQRFAHWTNLSETTFVLPPTAAGADYQ